MYWCDMFPELLASSNKSLCFVKFQAPITVFTPLQYSTVGLSEEMAVDKHGLDSIEVSMSDFSLYIVI